MYRYWVLLHLAGVLGLLASHGVSMFALYRIRHLGLDREKIAETVSFSGTTTRPMYVSLVALLVGGIAAAIMGHYLSDLWIILAIVVLVLTIGAMLGMAAPYFRKVTAACAMRPSGVPRTSDEELQELVGGSTAHVITAIGATGLLVILYLMIFKPGLGA